MACLLHEQTHGTHSLLLSSPHTRPPYTCLEQRGGPDRPARLVNILHFPLGEWHITCTDGGSPVLTFVSIETEEEYDFVRLHDGPTADSANLFEISGSLTTHRATEYTGLTGTGASVTIEFETDESVSVAAGGYQATYSCGMPPPPPDCAGTPGGTAAADMCNTCDRDPSNDCIQDCAGIWGGGELVDECGVCGGDGLTCCDHCGMCDLDAANDCAQDCSGQWGGTAVVDNCRTCDADATNDCTQDCAAVWGGPSVEDNCGVCGGDGSTCRDCPAGDVATPRCSVAVTTGCCVGPLAPPPPPPQDCVYTYGDCNADCMKPYLITTPPSGGGRACGQFQGTLMPNLCSPGDGRCPATPPPPPEIIVNRINPADIASHLPIGGRIESAGDHSWYSFDCRANDDFQIEVVLAPSYGDIEDSVMTIVDTDRATALVENDDDERPGADPDSYASYVDWTCPADGTYFVLIRAYGRETGTFSLIIGKEAANTATIVDPCQEIKTLSGSGRVATLSYQPAGSYGNDAVCRWEIVCPAGPGGGGGHRRSLQGAGGDVVHFTFTALNTEQSWDFVSLFDSPSFSADQASLQATQLDHLSGNLIDVVNPNYISTGSTLLIEFETDESTGGGGFEATYECSPAPPPPPPPPPAPCAAGDLSTPPCDAAVTTGCCIFTAAPPPPPVSPPPPPHAVDTGFQISAPITAFGVQQAAELTAAGDEEWFSFDAVAGQTYQMEVTLQNCAGCLSDSIIDLVDADHTTVIVENDDDDRIGQVTMESFIEWTCEVTGTYYLEVRAYRDYTGSFEVMITQVAAAEDPCNGAGITMTETSASIVFQPEITPEEQTDCHWMIQCPTGLVPVLTFESFNTEEQYDYIRVYDGLGETGTEVATYTGSIDTAADAVTVSASLSSATVKFEADDSVGVENGGFVAAYACEAPPAPPAPPTYMPEPEVSG